MSIADQGKTPLELMAQKVVDGRFVIGAARFSQLNPEQQLAYMLEQLIVLNKQKLSLMESVNLFAKECIEWRKTPEGIAWTEKQARLRAAKEVTP